MPRSGLTKERVVAAAAERIERAGAAAFSMHALAEELGVKTASLYNHVESMDALLASVCAYTLAMQREAELAAIAPCRDTEEAITALAEAARRFAKEHRALYRLVLSLAADCGEEQVGQLIVEPYLRVLDGTALGDAEKLHWQRVLRAIVHGFLSQEDAGFFAHLPVDAEESFRVAIRCYIDGLHEAERRARA